MGWLTLYTQQSYFTIIPLKAVIDRDQFHIRFFGLRLIRTCLQSQLPADMSNRRNVVHSFKIELTVNGTS